MLSLLHMQLKTYVLVWQTNRGVVSMTIESTPPTHDMIENLANLLTTEEGYVSIALVNIITLAG